MLKEGGNFCVRHDHVAWRELRRCRRLHLIFQPNQAATFHALLFCMARENDLRKRTMAFAVAVSDFCELLPQSYKGRHVAGQVFRSGTAVASNYRSACRARSRPDFIAKLGLVIEEADESGFWLEFAAESRLLKPGPEKVLRVEAGEQVAIFTQSQKTARADARQC
jgi:four helix bundle protein